MSAAEFDIIAGHYHGKQWCEQGWKLFKWGDAFKCFLPSSSGGGQIDQVKNVCENLHATLPTPTTALHEVTLRNILIDLGKAKTAIGVMKISGRFLDDTGTDFTHKMAGTAGTHVSFQNTGKWNSRLASYQTFYLCMRSTITTNPSGNIIIWNHYETL